jgi:hypothetical protein
MMRGIKLGGDGSFSREKILLKKRYTFIVWRHECNL